MKIEMLFQYLERYGSVTQRVRERLRSQVKIVRLAKGQFLFKAGQRMDRIYFLETGTIEWYRQSEGKRAVTWISVAETIVFQPELFIDGSAGSDALVALEECLLLCITQEDLQNLFNEFPETKKIAKAVVFDLQKQLRQHIYQINNTDKASRVMYLIETFPQLFYRFDRELLSSFLGLSESTFYRLKKKYLRHKPE